MSDECRDDARASVCDNEEKHCYEAQIAEVMNGFVVKVGCRVLGGVEPRASIPLRFDERGDEDGDPEAAD